MRYTLPMWQYCIIFNCLKEKKKISLFCVYENMCLCILVSSYLVVLLTWQSFAELAGNKSCVFPFSGLAKIIQHFLMLYENFPKGILLNQMSSIFCSEMTFELVPIRHKYFNRFSNFDLRISKKLWKSFALQTHIKWKWCQTFLCQIP